MWRLAGIVSQPGVPLHPSGMSDPVNWHSPSGVMLALVTAEAQFGSGGRLHHFLPESLTKSPPIDIKTGGQKMDEDGNPVIY